MVDEFSETHIDQENQNDPVWIMQEGENTEKLKDRIANNKCSCQKIIRFQKVSFHYKYCSIMLAQGHTQGSTLQQHTNKTLTIDPFGNTCEADEVSPEVEVGGVVGLKCLQPIWDTYM
jgi:hypothetical protein